MSSLGKMIKFEIKDSYKRVLMFCGLNLVSFAFIALLILMSSTDFFQSVLGIILFIIAYLTVIVILLISSIGLIYNIYQSINKKLFTNEGYLTFCLPVSTDSIILSKLIVNVLWIIVYLFSVIVGVFFMMLLIEFKNLTSILESIYISINLSSIDGWTVVMFFFYIIIGIIAICITILYVFTILAYLNSGSFKKHKGFLFVVIYFLTSDIITTILILISQFAAFGIAYNYQYDKYIFDFGANLLEGYYVVNFTSLIVYAGAATGLYFLVRYLLKKKIELIQ